MKKLFAMLFMLLLLAACGTAEPVTETAVVTEPTATTASGATSVATSAATNAASGEAGITPATNSIEAGVVRDRDWKQGAADPLITIIEYGDFQ